MGNDREWTGWRFELTSRHDYIELSFEGVYLRQDSDVTLWAAELRLALSHYPPNDMLLDLRGLHVSARCGERCSRELSDILDRHAASVAYYGASAGTLDALEPCLREHTDQSGSIRSRSPALAQLMQNRRRRLGLLPMAHLSRDFLAGGNGWDESGAAFI